MSTVNPPQVPNVRTVKVIGFRKRFLAMLIDLVLLFVFTFVLTFLVGLLGGMIQLYNPRDIFQMDTLIALSGVIFSFIYIVGSWVRTGKTIGKSVVGIKVVDENGAYPTWGRAILRFLGYILSGAVFSLGFIWAGFDKKYQGWHDKIARTYVVDSFEEFKPQEKLSFVPAENRKAWGALILWLILALVAPSALLSSLYLLGPTIGLWISSLLKN